MTAKELMNTRFEVIADYPSSPFVVGDVIAYDGIVYGMGQPQKFTREPEKYPHIFRKMNWWEKRTAEYNVSQQLICDIKKYRRWKDIT